MKNSTENKMLTMRLSQDEYEELQKQAENKYQNVSTYVKNAIKASYTNSPKNNMINPIQDYTLADALKQMIEIKNVLEKNSNKIPKEVIQEMERRLEKLWDTLK